jgi:hypothetical protein
VLREEGGGFKRILTTYCVASARGGVGARGGGGARASADVADSHEIIHSHTLTTRTGRRGRRDDLKNKREQGKGCQVVEVRYI